MFFLFLPGLHVSFTTLLSSPFAFSTFPLFRLFLHFFQLPALSLFAENILATVSLMIYTYASLPISAQQIILALIISFVNLFFYSGLIFLKLWVKVCDIKWIDGALYPAWFISHRVFSSRKRVNAGERADTQLNGTNPRLTDSSILSKF